MSKRNYSNYSKPKAKPEPEVASIVQEVEPVIEGQTVIQEVVEPEATTMLTASVANCTRLNVREAPSTSAEVLTVLEAGTEVQIIEKIDADPSFYKVCTASGIEGYCMCEYIVLN